VLRKFKEGALVCFKARLVIVFAPKKLVRVTIILVGIAGVSVNIRTGYLWTSSAELHFHTEVLGEHIGQAVSHKIKGRF
jgi:hypothetical protein